MTTKQLIDRDEVIKILEASEALHSSDMGEMINKFFEKEILSLPIEQGGVEDILNKMIEEIDKEEGVFFRALVLGIQKGTLKEAISRIKSPTL